VAVFSPDLHVFLPLGLQHGNLGQLVVKNMIQPGRTCYNTAQALGWALDVAHALEYLHMRSPAVLHRDVKSANIMMTDDEGSMVAKLSDFGLHVVSAQWEASCTAAGVKRML
jgi:serine/threonine protein kinase